MKRNIRKRAFLLISTGFNLGDISSTLSDAWKKFDPKHPIDSLEKILKDHPEVKQKIQEEISSTKGTKAKGTPTSKAIEKGVGSSIGGPPLGYHSAKNLTPEMVQLADKILGENKEMGYYENHVIDGRNLRYQLETHYDNHPKLNAFKQRLKTWRDTGEIGPKPEEPEPFDHPGVSVYETESEIKPLDKFKKEDRDDDILSSKWIGDLLNRTETSSSSLASAVVNIAKSDVGVKETSDNYGPDIIKYFEKLGRTLPKEGLPWCAAAVSSWLKSAGVPIKGSAGSLELGSQFQQLNKWTPREKITSKDLVPGNVLVWKRPDAPGRGHVGIIYKVINDNTVEVIEGNGIKSDSVAAGSTRKLSDSRLLGIGLVSEMG